MKIISRGTPPSEREWRFNCGDCKSVFECLQSEGKYTSDQRDGAYLTVQCPVCSRICYGSLK